MDTFEQLDEALTAGADVIMLDNFDNDAVKKAIAIVGGRAVLEASGGITIERITTLATLGDRRNQLRRAHALRCRCGPRTRLGVAADIAARLETDTLGRSLEWRGSTGSTMDDAHVAAAAGAVHGHTVVAGEQSAGRGARGRVWHSPDGAHLYLSVVLRHVVH